ncbi:GNAT family N-acetyltransferase [Mucilaginibacter corticis]|uniref:GNAT family N-acetyltransferase n=1 Tax=Mucilaginibacter corticis TaxID=2597670 RepID=A0A556MTD8_9SPHI|nr:GNAT family N-acetyltransferase [Mucilaginibacter corticis]TSJ43193.1 GNAT family N-acetyltransferase [Mucilaginibacter corticis]
MTNAAKTYTTERLSVSNIADLAVLNMAVYGRELPLGFFQKKYDTVYTGTSHVGFIAYNLKHLPIAFYGLVPTLLWYKGGTILAAQSVDTMTHPDYRGLGLFVKLAEQTYRICGAEGIRLIFGFPNQNSFPGLANKLGWQFPEVMLRFKVPVKTRFPLERIANKFTVVKPIYQHYQKWILKDHLVPQHGIANSVLDDGYNGVYRDARYLKYKTFTGTSVIRIGQALLWVKLQNGLHIGDIENIGDDFEDTMQKLISLTRKLGIGEIHFQVSPQNKLYSLFSKHYPAHPSYAIGFKDLGAGISIENIKFTFADIDIF